MASSAGVEQLNEVDVSGVAPMAGGTNMAAGYHAVPMRADVVTDGGYPDKVLSNAPNGSAISTSYRKSWNDC